jgi:hypothetical protein
MTSFICDYQHKASAALSAVQSEIPYAGRYRLLHTNAFWNNFGAVRFRQRVIAAC